MSFNITKKEIIKAIYDSDSGLWGSDDAESVECLSDCENLIYSRKWLDFEPLFKDVGWDVEYIGPTYYETFDAYFNFSAKV